MAVPTQQQAYDSLGAVYDPQTSLINTQIAQLQPQQDAQQSALDQAKVNAFRDIDTSANAKGVLFSGFSPDEQARYVGTKYLPAVANLKATYQNNKNTLLGKINEINANRTQQAQGIVTDAQAAAAKTAYDNARLAVSASKSSGGSSSSSSKASVSGAADQINSRLGGLTGRDGYLSPYDYNAALSAWAQDGLPVASFSAIFGHYKNPKTKGYQ